jgi:hypothetical protein
MRIRHVLLATALATAAGCSGHDATAPQFPNFDGTYTLAGTVNGQPTEDIAGTLAITNQSGTNAAVALTASLRDSGTPIFSIITTTPQQALLGRDGSFSVTFNGTGTLAGQSITLVTKLSGALSGNQILGTWSLTTSYPTSDAGTFAAQR